MTTGIGWGLAPEDFPLASAGNLVFSPRKGDPVMTCASVVMARQVVRVMNWTAREEGALWGPGGEDWLKLQ